MVSILRHTDLMAGTGYRYLLLLAPLVLIGVPLACGVAIGEAGFAAGLPPVEYASGFVLKTSATLPGATLAVAALAIILGSAAGFALSCTGLSKTKSGLARIFLRAVSRYCSSSFILRLPCVEILRLAFTGFSGPTLSSPRLRAAPTAAGLSGALPLLN